MTRVKLCNFFFIIYDIHTDNFMSKSRVSPRNSLRLGLGLHAMLAKKFHSDIPSYQSGDCLLDCDVV
jgi:hypothetical protein